MNRKLAGVLAATVGVIALGVGAGTYAAYSDTEAGPNASATAGTLDLVLSDGPSTTQPITLSNMAPTTPPSSFVYQPSDRFYETKLTNDGSLPGTVQWRFQGLQSFENGCIEPEAPDGTCGDPGAGQGELASQLRVVFSMLDANCGGSPVVVSDPIIPNSSTVFAPLAAFGQPSITLPGGGSTRCVRADVFFASGANDDFAQGDSATFQFEFRLDQST